MLSPSRHLCLHRGEDIGLEASLPRSSTTQVLSTGKRPSKGPAALTVRCLVPVGGGVVERLCRPGPSRRCARPLAPAPSAAVHASFSQLGPAACNCR